jgi:hypothetical protein
LKLYVAVKNAVHGAISSIDSRLDVKNASI